MKNQLLRRKDPAFMAELKKLAPSVAIDIGRCHDEHFRWDGDGPDPKRRGYFPYDITVTVTAIVDGELVDGENHLGGSYFKPGEAFGDVHGYLPQMIDEAVSDLAKDHHITGTLLAQLNAIHQHMEGVMRNR